MLSPFRRERWHIPGIGLESLGGHTRKWDKILDDHGGIALASGAAKSALARQSAAATNHAGATSNRERVTASPLETTNMCDSS